MEYAADEHWALVHEPGLLLLHAGADELFAIEDVSDGAGAELRALWDAEVMRPERLSQEAADVFEQLKAAGIVRNLLAPRLEYAIDVRFAGAPDAALREAIANVLPAGIVVTGGPDADLVLFVRTNGALAKIAGEDYASLMTPHLLLDLAYGHTICLGPLVFAGETACLSCLVSRLSHYWGDVAPPARPRVTEHRGLSAGLAAMAIANILLREDRSLVNRTVAYDFGAHNVQANSVYRLPICPACGRGAAARGGSIELPWAAAR